MRKIFIPLTLCIILLVGCTEDPDKYDFKEQVNNITKAKIETFYNQHKLNKEQIKEMKSIIINHYNQNRYKISEADTSLFDVVVKVYFKNDMLIILYLKDKQELYFINWILDKGTQPISYKTLMLNVQDDFDIFLNKNNIKLVSE